MPLGYECRSKLLKQVPHKPTQRRGKKDMKSPGPMQYDQPELFGGKGFSHIKRSPAYTFGLQIPCVGWKSAAKPNAPLFNIRGMGKKGCYRISHGIVATQLPEPKQLTSVPGPGAHEPRPFAARKRPPVYSIRQAAKPPYEAWDQWTPPPNMYCPPIPKAKPPAYSIGNIAKCLPEPPFPGPGEHDPKFEYVKKKTPAFSFGAPFVTPKGPEKWPAPNTYCEKKFMVSKRTIPAPSFGIRHTPYLGKQAEYLLD